MMKYNYKVIDLTNRSVDVENALNSFAKHGYRYVNSHVEDGAVQIILEKKVEE